MQLKRRFLVVALICIAIIRMMLAILNSTSPVYLFGKEENKTEAVVVESRINIRSPIISGGDRLEASNITTATTTISDHLEASNITTATTTISDQHRYDIAILVTSDNAYQEKYRHHTDSQICYTEYQGYELLNKPGEWTGVLAGKKPANHFSSRHGHVLDALNRGNDTLDYLVFMDGDGMVMNFNHRIEDFIDPDVDIVLNNRLLNNLVCAGAYIIKNTEWSKSFLEEWIYTTAAADADNGALMRLLMKRIFLSGNEMVATVQEKQLAQYCLDNFRSGTYEKFECCFWSLLQGRRKFNNIKINRRSHGFFRDDIMGKYLMEGDFVVHNKRRWELADIKPDNSFRNSVTGKCYEQPKIGTIWPELTVTGKYKDHLFCKSDIMRTKDNRVWAPDVYECHPNCPETVDAKWNMPSIDRMKDYCWNNYPQKTFNHEYNDDVCGEEPPATFQSDEL